VNRPEILRDYNKAIQRKRKVIHRLTYSIGYAKIKTEERQKTYGIADELYL